MKSKKKNITMEQLTQGYDSFIKGRELKENGKKTFEKTIKKATKPKPRGLK